MFWRSSIKSNESNGIYVKITIPAFESSPWIVDAGATCCGCICGDCGLAWHPRNAVLIKPCLSRFFNKCVMVACTPLLTAQMHGVINHIDILFPTMLAANPPKLWIIIQVCGGVCTGLHRHGYCSLPSKAPIFRPINRCLSCGILLCRNV